jgi:hypothetical protein
MLVENPSLSSLVSFHFQFQQTVGGRVLFHSLFADTIVHTTYSKVFRITPFYMAIRKTNRIHTSRGVMNARMRQEALCLLCFLQSLAKKGGIQ